MILQRFFKLATFVSFSTILVLSSCSNQPNTISLPSLPPSALIDGLAFFPQRSDQCGPESLAMMLSAMDIEVAPQDLSPLVYLPKRGGTLALELTAQARQFGLLVYPVISFVDILNQVSVGNPVLVMQNLGLNWYPQWHFSVVIGYDLSQQNIVLRSGSQQHYSLPFYLFERTWKRANNWGIITLADGELPALPDPKRYIRAAVDLESLGFFHQAQLAYQQAISYWPDNQLAQFGLANVAFSQQHYQLAYMSYSKIIELNPHHLEAWNNLAFTYERLGCGEKALQSIGCAVNISPQNKTIQHSLSELSNIENNNHNNCPIIPTCP